MMKKRGMLIVISGPSGVGKGTVANRLLEKHDNICFSVSATTRAMREGEAEGVNYFYKTTEEFDTMIEQGEFLEYMMCSARITTARREATLNQSAVKA